MPNPLQKVLQELIDMSSGPLDERLMSLSPQAEAGEEPNKGSTDLPPDDLDLLEAEVMEGSHAEPEPGLDDGDDGAAALDAEKKKRRG